MSFKGFQKGIVRAPQSIRAKFNMGEHTKDAVYSDAERRFQELEKETKKLHDESQKYFNAINGVSFFNCLDSCHSELHDQRNANKMIPGNHRHAEPPNRIFQGHDGTVQTHLRSSL